MAQLNAADLAEIETLCSGGVIRDVNLSALSQWRIGGRAEMILRPSSTNELARLRKWFYDREMPHVVIGLTSNLLFSDEGLRVPCIQISSRMAHVEIDGTVVRAQAGAWVPGLARRLMQTGLTGAEHICGIPGTLGGLVCMNGGSQRQGIGSNILSVESVDRYGRVIVRTSVDCGFDYRQSAYQTNGEIIARVKLAFKTGHHVTIRRQMQTILADRRKKFPRKEPNCGSVFKSHPNMYSEIGSPGAAIERLGLKGFSVGEAQVSNHHANFIINKGRARSQDVLSLIGIIQNVVYKETGYILDCEAYYLDPNGNMRPAGSNNIQHDL